MFKVGERVYRWWDSGALGSEQQELLVCRVNRITYTVQTKQGSVFRVPHSEIVGLVDWEDG